MKKSKIVNFKCTQDVVKVEQIRGLSIEKESSYYDLSYTFE